jgi:hypothetical protein
MKRLIPGFIVVICACACACALKKVQAYNWFEEERTISNRFFLHLQIKTGDKLSPIVLPYETFFRMEETPKGVVVEIYKSPTGNWEDISWDLSQGELVSIVKSDDVCPLLEKGEYVFKTTNNISGDKETNFVFGPKTPKEKEKQMWNSNKGGWVKT